jgi:hypothetical protein
MANNATTDAAASTKVVTGKVRFSYLHVFEPTAVEEGQEKKYSVSLIIPKSDKPLLNKIKAAIEAAKEQGKTSKFGGKVPTNLKTPLRDGDVDRPDDEVYANSYFINANCKTKPGLVDKDLNPILDQADLYSGCYGRASITFYPFNTSGNKGIAAGLNNLQKLAEGEPLGGRSRAEDDFGEASEDDDLM